MGFLVKVSNKKIEEIQLFLEEAVEYIIRGKIICFPTDSVYGIGGDPLNLIVNERIHAIKFRDKAKGFLILVADFEEASKIVEFNETARILAENYWPGQLTLILKRKEPNIIPMEVGGFQNTIGVRVPDHPIILSILKILKERGRFGGIIGTSANYSGEPPCISGEEVARKILAPIDLIIDDGKSKSKIPSTIIDCSTDEIKFFRIGILSEDDILAFLSSKMK